jgi:hypothetical protein
MLRLSIAILLTSIALAGVGTAAATAPNDTDAVRHALSRLTYGVISCDL